MVIRFVLDPFACTRYCASYKSKGESDVSKLLRDAMKDARRGNNQIKNSMQTFAKLLINGSKISAQEASGFILGLPNHSCSRADIFINTALPDERIRILKSNEELQKLDDSSEDVCQKGLLDHYVNPIRRIGGNLFGRFCISIRVFVQIKRKTDESNGSSTRICADSGFVRKRNVRKIIRFCHFKKSDHAKYCR